MEINEPKDLGVHPFDCTSTLRESHRQNIYGAAFNQYRLPEETPIFATVGSNWVSVYEVPLVEEQNGNKNLIKLIASYKDGNDDEAYYAVCWAIDPQTIKSLLCFGGKFGFIRVVDATSGQMIRMLSGHGQAVNELRAHPSKDGIVASCSVDLTVIIWNVNQSNYLVRLGGFRGHRNQLLSLDWSECGNYIVTGSMDHSIKLWSLKGKPGQKIDQSLGIVEEPNTESKYSVQTGDEFALAFVRHVSAKKESSKTQPAMVQHPCCTTNELHTNYVDCVRLCGPFVFSKAVSQNCIYVWKFGKFEEKIAGLDHLVKPDSLVSMLSSLRLDNNVNWFAKFELDPFKKWLLCGNNSSAIYAYNIRDKIMEGKAQQVLKVFDGADAQVRQVCFEPYGRLAMAVGDRGLLSRIDRWTEDRSTTIPIKRKRLASQDE
ncbi:unnamed protein product, partial [Mesorhabditis belari]|uniref:Uncharacterized protein n=1 Tax=Mesorhabditis belari TaxID=2138241 RepID=A0AAF3EVT9_9BILA